MANLFIFPFRPAYDGNMKAIPGAQLWFTLEGSDEPTAAYADSDLLDPLANPVVANGVGRWPTLWLDNDISYRVRVYDADAEVGVDTPVEEYDPYDGTFSIVTSELISYTHPGTDAADRTVFDKLQETVSVKDFGAVGDGETDDGPAIMAALASGAKTVHLPDGTYQIFEDILTPVSGQRIVGAGEARIRRRSVATFRTKPIFLLQNVIDVEIEGLQLEVDEAGAYTKHYAVHLRATALGDTQRITIKNCKFYTTYVYVERYCSHVRFQNNSVFGGDLTVGGFATGGIVDLTTGVSTNSNGLVEQIWIEDCYFERTYGEAIDLNWHTRNVTISRCHFHNCAADDLNEVIDIGSDAAATDVYNCQNIIMSDLLITDSANMAQAAIQIKGNTKRVQMSNITIVAEGVTPGTASIGVYIWNSHTVSINGLTVEGFAYGVITKEEAASYPTDFKLTNFNILRYGVDGIQIAATRSLVSMGTIDGTGSTAYGIDAPLLTKSSIESVHVRDAVLVGIRLQENSTDCLIRGCDIETSVGSGVTVLAGCDRTRVLGNHFRSNGAYGLSFAACDRCLVDSNISLGNSTAAFNTASLTNSTIGSNITA